MTDEQVVLNALRRICQPILLAQQRREAPLFSGTFFKDGFPPEEKTAIRRAVGEEAWDALTSMYLVAGNSGVLLPNPIKEEAAQ